MAASRKRGKRGKFNPTTCQRLISLIRDGQYANTACLAAGISETTYYRWLEKGEQSKAGPYREFFEAIREAEGQAETRQLENVLKAGNGYDVTRVVVKHSPVTDSKGMPVLGPDGRPLFTETREIVTSREFVWQAAAWYLERRYPKKYGRRFDMTSGDEPLRQPVLVLNQEKFLHGDGQQPDAKAAEPDEPAV